VPYKIAGLFVFLIIAGCGSVPQTLYDSDVLLTNIKVNSENSTFSVRLPIDWYKTSAKDESPFELWLNVSNFSKTIVFIPVNIASNEDRSMAEIFELIKSVKLANNPNSKLIREEVFSAVRKVFYAFEYSTSDKELFRVVLFRHNSDLFECTAMFDGRHTPTNSEIRDLFATQNSILNSISN